MTDNDFAAACYNDNTIPELQESLAGPPDETDMATWGITADGWRSSIEQALTALLAEAEQE